MALRARPTIPSDLTQEQAFNSDTGIPHATSLDTHLTIHYWITTRSILLNITQDRREASYDTIYFTPFSSEVAWKRLYQENTILNKISVQINDTTTPTFPSLASSMPKSLTPATPPTHSSLSNQTVDTTTALIALMQHSLQQNAAMMAQINSRPPPPPAPQPSPLYQYKPHHPPFTKWDGTPPTTTLFLAHIATYKA